MNLIEKIKTYLSTRKKWVTVIDEIREERDAFEEQCYDLRWHLERQVGEFQEAYDAIKSERDDLLAELLSMKEAFAEMRQMDAERVTEAYKRVADVELQMRMFKEQQPV